jgi:hypothetical protein
MCITHKSDWNMLVNIDIQLNIFTSVYLLAFNERKFP